MKRNRWTALLLAALMLLTLLTACGESPAKAAQTESAEPEAASEEQTQDTLAQEEEFFLEREEGCNQLTLYWNDPGADYSKCDVWVWFPGRDGSGQLFHPCAYGAKCMVNVPEDVSEVGFIVRRDCSDPGGTSWGEATKDVDGDRFALMDGDTVIYLQPGDAMQYTSPDGGKTLEPIRSFTMAGILSPTEIRYNLSPSVKLESLDQVHVRQDGREVEIESLSSLNNKVVTGVITVKEELDVSKPYTVEIEGYGEIPALPTAIFDSEEFIENYTYDGDDLGAVIDGDHTVFKVWAPTAGAVTLNLFEAGNDCDAYETLEMTRGEKGVWSAEAPAVDPYARALGVNGDRGMVVDLRKTDPAGFRDSAYDSGLSCYGDAVIWEVHVRDFSNTIAQSQYPGKYLAFTDIPGNTWPLRRPDLPMTAACPWA